METLLFMYPESSGNHMVMGVDTSYAYAALRLAGGSSVYEVDEKARAACVWHVNTELVNLP